MAARNRESVEDNWSLLRERVLTTGLCSEGWYSEHSGVCRRAELPGRSVIWRICSVPRNKGIMVKCIWTISRSSVFCDQSKASVVQKLQHSSWVPSPFLVLRQYFRATIVPSLQPASSRKLKTFSGVD